MANSEAKSSNIRKMNQINWPIERENMWHGYIALSNGINYLKERSILFISESDASIRDNFISVDLNYESPQYQVERVATSHLGVREPLEPNENLRIGYRHGQMTYLNNLLSYFGFSEKLDEKEYMTVLNTLFNGKFPYDYCEHFGYQKKPNMIWKQGVLVPNTEINVLSDYDIKKYRCVDSENPLSDAFRILIEVDYRNPEAIFEPLEEEGPIRKRNYIQK